MLFTNQVNHFVGMRNKRSIYIRIGHTLSLFRYSLHLQYFTNRYHIIYYLGVYSTLRCLIIFNIFDSQQ